MKITNIVNYMQVERLKSPIVACIGYFDGLHTGHQKLIKATIAKARQSAQEATLITFNPDPWTIIKDKSHVLHLTPMKEKIKLCESYGIDHVIIINFTKELSQLSPDDFVNRLLLPLNISDLICGRDFKFGFKGEGKAHTLSQDYSTHFTTHIVELNGVGDRKIGTTDIIQAILHGHIQKANHLLGRHYSISGFVVGGRHEGRKLGFPTANLDVVDEYVIPKTGIYVGTVTLDDVKYRSVVNVGYNPTFNTRDHVSIESHILDFSEDIYGKVVKQTFIQRLRDEIKFATVDDLIVQMKQDVLDGERILDELES